MKIKILAVFLAVFILSAPAFARDDQRPEYLKELGVLVGYGDTSVRDKNDYRALPVILRVGVDMDKMELGICDWIEKGAALFGREWELKGYTEFLLEPFLSYVPSPDDNFEGGFVIAIKFAYPLTEKFHPYAFGGGGVMYITQHLREQSTQYNFTPQLGAGFSYFFKPGWALNAEYRYRHFSNAGLKHPNDGINIDMVLVGITRFFD